MKLYETSELTKQLEYLVDNSDELTDEQQEDILKMIDNLGLAVEEKVEGIACVLDRIKSDEQILADEIKRLQARKKSLEREQERIKEYLLINMQATNTQKIKTAKRTISLKKCPASVVVEPEFRIDETDAQFVIIEKKLDKKAVKDFYSIQIKLGNNPVLPMGIKIIDNKQTVQIR